MIGRILDPLSPAAKSHAGRTRHSKRIQRALLRRGWIEGVMRESRRLAETIKDCPPAILREHTDLLRKFTREGQRHDDERILALAGAGVIEAIRQTLALELFDVQLHAGIVISCGAVAEMQTGEGKTLSAVLPAYVRALSARGVHVATPNRYLAHRDHEKLAPVFRRLGMSTGLVHEDSSVSQSRDAYQADITYGPGHCFGFDYLRDQLTLAGGETHSLGSSILKRIQGLSPESHLLQRGLYASIIDEIDHVLIDDAVSPLLLSSSGNGEAPDAEVHRAAQHLAQRFTEGVEFTLDGLAGRVQLTSAGFDRAYDHDDLAIHASLRRPWHEYVALALRSRHLMKRDVHYVVQEGQIQIIDGSTGRIFQDRTWSDGLHQAVQASEGVKITIETAALARITRQRFYRYYESLGGMTGTATGCESEFAAVYGLPVIVIPLRLPTKRHMLDEHVSLSREEKFRAIAQETESFHRQGRAVLIGTLNISESLSVAECLKRLGLSFELLNGVQDADEASIISRAGAAGAITVATNLAGRGTDIALQPRVAKRGGLHVIVTEKHSLSRVDRQLIGRCARGGDPGTARIYISAEDTLPMQHAPWLERAIRRSHRDNTDAALIHRRLSRVQRGLQRQQAAQRWTLLQSDQEQEELVRKNRSTPAHCWQL